MLARRVVISSCFPSRLKASWITTTILPVCTTIDGGMCTVAALCAYPAKDMKDCTWYVKIVEFKCDPDFPLS